MYRSIKKIVIIGPESTGKSTLTEALAQMFAEPWVPEYARTYLDRLDMEYRYEDLLEIAKGQVALEEQQAKQAIRFLFCDTDLHVVHVWSQHKYGKTDPWILEQIASRKYDLYLLTNIDTPWQEDPQREHPDPEMRKYFFDRYKRIVSESATPYSIISGNPEIRLEKAVRLINKIFG